MIYLAYIFVFIAGFSLAIFILSLVKCGSECDNDMLMLFIEEMRKDLKQLEETNKYLRIANEQLQQEINMLQKVQYKELQHA